MGVHVDKKIIQIFFGLVIDIYGFFCTWCMKKCENANSSHKMPTFWE